MDVGAKSPLHGEQTVELDLTPARSERSDASLQVATTSRPEVVPPVSVAPVTAARAVAQAARQLDITHTIHERGELMGIDMIHLGHPRSELRGEFAPLVHGVVVLLNETNITPTNPTNSKELVQAAIENEKLTTKTVNTLLGFLDNRVPLCEQRGQLRDVQRLTHQMGQITLSMLELPREFYLEHASSDVQALAAKLTPRVMQQGTKYEHAERQLLNKTEVFIIVSLMKLSQSPKGEPFIRELNNTLSQNGHIIAFQILKKTTASSLLAFSLGPQAYIVKNTQPPEVIKYNPQRVAQEIGLARSGNSGYFSPNAGSSSLFGIPVWPKIEIDPSTDEGHQVMEDLLHLVTTEEALGRLVTGSFSFTKDAQMFYTPAHIEVSHELIHVRNNSLGVNTTNVEITDLSRRVWKDEEERTTITGCHGVPHSENSLGEDYKLPERHGHAGLPVSSLSDEKILSKAPKELSGLNNE